MDETIKLWLIDMYNREIEETQSSISNEHIMELGSTDSAQQSHTQNIETMQAYLEVLKQKIAELEKS